METVVRLIKRPAAQPMHAPCYLCRVFLFLFGVDVQHRRIWELFAYLFVELQSGDILLCSLPALAQYCSHELSHEERLSVLLMPGYKLDATNSTEADALIGKDHLSLGIIVSQRQFIFAYVNVSHVCHYSVNG